LHYSQSQQIFVLLGTGKIIQSKRIYRAGNNSQVALNAGTQTDARFRRTVRDDRFDQRMVNEGSRNVGGRRSRHDKIKITNNLFPASITARDTNMKGIRMSAQILLQRFSLSRDASQLERAGMFSP